MNFARSASAWTLLAPVLCGCGGTGATNPAEGPGTGSLTTQLGDATVTYSGKVTPFIAAETSGGPTVVGMAGAAISQIHLAPAPHLDNTTIAFLESQAASVFSGNVEVWSNTNNVLAQLTQGPNPSIFVCFGPTGQMAMSSFDPVTKYRQISTCNYDGSGTKQITSSTSFNCDAPAWAPNNSKIAFVGGTTLYTVSPTGGALTKIGSGIDPTWSPDSKTIAFSAVGSGNVYQIYTMPAIGGTPTLVSGPYSAANCYEAAWSPDGKTLAFAVNSGSTWSIAESDVANPTVTYLLPGGGDDANPVFSPDGKYLAIERNGLIYTIGVNGDSPTPLQVPAAGAAGAWFLEPAWSPFLAAKTFVGSGGPMGAAASGFLISRLGDNLASLTTFTAKTPSTATITQASGSTSGGELSFDLHADSISQVAYAQGYYLPPITYSSVGTSDVLVFLNQQTGAVDLVTPFRLTKGQGIVARRSGGTTAYAAQFADIYDGHGKSLAPAGASEITVDNMSGRLVSTRP